MIIAIDGPAAAGKGTLGRRLAQALGLPYLDTGVLYRAVGRRVLEAGADPADAAAAQAQAEALRPEDLARSDLRSPEADQAASLVATVPGVRAALLAFQRSFATTGGAVLDGRDIGTVIFPDADVKLFVTASVEARAERRWREHQARPLDVVTAELRARDGQDAAREAAPLRPADDAIVLDTTVMNSDQAYTAAFTAITKVLPLLLGGTDQGSAGGSPWNVIGGEGRGEGDTSENTTCTALTAAPLPNPLPEGEVF